MKKILLLATIIVSFFSLTAIESCKSASGSPGKLLKFNLEKGKEYNYDMNWDMDQKIMGNDTKISIGALFSLAVTADNGSEKEITSTYKRFVMNMKMMGIEIDVDTDKPAPAMSPEEIKANPMGLVARVFTGIAGKSFTMKVDAEGKVLSVSGFQEIIQSMIDSMGLDENMKATMMASLKDQFNEESIKDQFAQVFTIFPNKEVKVGDSWEKNFTTEGKMPANYITAFKVKQIDGDLVTLTAVTDIKPAGDTATTAVKGTQTGNLQIDSKTGLMVNGDFDQKLEIKASGMTIEMNGKGRIKGSTN